MTPEQIIIAVVVLILGIGIGMYIAKKTASSPDSIRAAAFETISEAVILASKLQSSVPAEVAAAAAQKAHEDSLLASLKDAVAKL